MAKALRFTEQQLKDFVARCRAVEREVDKQLKLQRARQSAEPGDSQVRVLRAASGNIQALFELQLLDAKLNTAPRFQFKPLPHRRIRLDCAWLTITAYIAIEVQGMVHRIKRQFKWDCERHNLLTEAGWTMYYVTGDMVRDGSALKLAKRLIGVQ